MLRLFFIFSLLYFGNCQDNAATNVAASLQECYNTTRYVTRDFRLPSTINVLVELIRKVEQGNPNLDAREIAISLLHRFRQDGIRKPLRTTVDVGDLLPYSPKGTEAAKNRIQLTKITPGNAVNFNNDSLTHLEGCSLHYMISSTIEFQNRGDENQVCRRTGRYTLRTKRQSELNEVNDEKSTCPIESGVISTKWGAVKAGILISGIAAGFQPNPITSEGIRVESSYASTLAGELAEAGINQPGDSKTVGNGGGWNSTVEPKYYFLESNERDRSLLTDAEIRGSLDGLFMSLSIDEWKSKFSNIKVSQILDLYYSRGVFNDSARACNRKDLTKDLVSNSKLVNQTIGFSKMLDDVSQLLYTIPEQKFPSLSQSIVDSFRSYLSSNLHDLECAAENDLTERVSTDILIFVDIGWQYDVIHPLISYILEAIDVNDYESSFTIFEGANCGIIANKSRSILDFYDSYNVTHQDLYPKGFDYSKVIQTAERIYKAKLNNETDLTGQSTIVLMLPHTNPVQSQSDYVASKRNEFRSSLPDLRILVGGPGSRTAYNDLVSSTVNDIFTVNDDPSSAEIKKTGDDIIKRIKKLPRNVVNPSCGSSFSSDGGQNFELNQYVEPLGINYHKISPHYFSGGQVLKIQGKGNGKLVACTSRIDANPKNASDTSCTDVQSNEVTLEIGSFCTDQSVTECDPIYISVQGVPSNTVSCSDKGCRFPDNIQYSINLENVHCSSSTQNVIATFMIICLLFAALKF